MDSGLLSALECNETSTEHRTTLGKSAAREGETEASMTCNYCRAHNEDDAHRCHRCGRRLSSSDPLAGGMPVSRTALAHDLAAAAAPAAAPEPKPVPKLAVVPPPAEAREERAARPGVQPSLFGPMEVSRDSAAAKPPRASSPKVRREKFEHPAFDFEQPDTVRTLQTSVAAAICSDAPVALLSQRAMAAIIDSTIGLTGAAVFMLTFRSAGFEFEWNQQSMLMLGVAAALISLLYRVLFCLGNGDTPGARMAGLRLIDFYGHAPKRKARLARLAGGCISTMACGMGLLWALFDEEHLTWHDHMSKTFPTMDLPEREG